MARLGNVDKQATEVRQTERVEWQKAQEVTEGYEAQGCRVTKEVRGKL